MYSLPDSEWLGSGSFYHHFNSIKWCFIPFLLLGLRFPVLGKWWGDYFLYISNGLLNSTVIFCDFTVHVLFCFGETFSTSKSAELFVVLIIKSRNLRRKGDTSGHNSNFSIVVKVSSRGNILHNAFKWVIQRSGSVLGENNEYKSPKEGVSVACFKKSKKYSGWQDPGWSFAFWWMAVNVEWQNECLPPCLVSVHSLENSSVVSIVAALHEVLHSLLSSCVAGSARRYPF